MTDTLNTTEQLDALPANSVVLDDENHVYQKIGISQWWSQAGSASTVRASEILATPDSSVTLLHRPKRVLPDTLGSLIKITQVSNGRVYDEAVLVEDSEYGKIWRAVREEGSDYGYYGYFHAEYDTDWVDNGDYEIEVLFDAGVTR